MDDSHNNTSKFSHPDSNTCHDCRYQKTAPKFVIDRRQQ